jgi:hypothetical protein
MVVPFARKTALAPHVACATAPFAGLGPGLSARLTSCARCAWWVACLLSLAIQPAAAQNLVPAQALHGAAPEQAYEQVMAEALAAHDAGQWLAAREKFAAAHALHPNAHTLRGMGLSAYEARQYAAAVSDLEAALVHPNRPLSAALCRAVHVVLHEAWPRVGAYRLHVQPDSAVLKVDGASPLWGPTGEVLLDPGTHTLAVTAPGSAEHHFELSVQGGERQEVRVALAPLPAEPALSRRPERDRLPDPWKLSERGLLPDPWRPPELPDDPWNTQSPTRGPPEGPLLPAEWLRDAPAPAPPPGPRLRRSAIATSALTGASALTALVLYGVVRGRFREMSDDCRSLPAGGCSQREAEALHQEQNLTQIQRSISVTLAVGATSLAATSVLWLLDSRARGRPRGLAALSSGMRF